MVGLGGLNKRAEPSGEDVYLTPSWAVSWLLDRWTPLGRVICDPCAGDGRIGRMVGGGIGGIGVKTWVTLELSDTAPLHHDVRQADFRGLVLSPTTGGRTIITNPPYTLLPEFVRWALAQPSVVEVVVLTRFGFLCAEQGRRAQNLVAYLQPTKRLAFELTREDGERKLAARARGEKIDVHIDPSTAYGYRMSSIGVDHGWAVYRPGYSGRVDLVIESAEKVEEAPW